MKLHITKQRPENIDNAGSADNEVLKTMRKQGETINAEHGGLVENNSEKLREVKRP